MKKISKTLLLLLFVLAGGAKADSNLDEEVLKSFVNHPAIDYVWNQNKNCKKSRFYELFLKSHENGIPYYDLEGRNLTQIGRLLFKRGKVHFCWSLEGELQLVRIAAELSNVYPTYRDR